MMQVCLVERGHGVFLSLTPISIRERPIADDGTGPGGLGYLGPAVTQGTPAARPF